MPQPPRHKDEDLESGFTTGTSATATTRAALRALMTDKRPEQVTVQLPVDEALRLPVWEVEQSRTECTYAIQKDAGDDPDVTDGAIIRSTVTFNNSNSVNLKGGHGVGRITRPGMPVDVGEPAINPVPRQMIRQAVQSELHNQSVSRGVTVCVSVEEGRELAEQTLNPRLGVEGGLSILGTTGLVEPYSHASYIASIEQGMDVAKANGLDQLIMATGGRTEEYAHQYHDLPDLAYVQFAGFLEESLDYLTETPFEQLFIYMMPGKFSKLMQGHLQLHSQNSRVDIDPLRDEIMDRFQWPSDEVDEMVKLESVNQLISYLNIDQLKQLAQDWVPRALRVILDEYVNRLRIETITLHLMTLQGDRLARESQAIDRTTSRSI